MSELLVAVVGFFFVFPLWQLKLTWFLGGLSLEAVIPFVMVLEVEIWGLEFSLPDRRGFV